jgi:hypothetical protein
LRLRRWEPLHEKLLREAGLESTPTEAPRTNRWLGFLDEAGITGLHRPREWDATAAVEAPELAGDEVEFVALPNGSLIAGEDVDKASLAPLVGAFGGELRRPYRARAVRRHGDVWAVAARQIDAVELRPDVEGDELELVSRGGERSLTVDGERAFGSVPQFERLAATRSADYALHASRLDGSLWEVRIDPL